MKRIAKIFVNGGIKRDEIITDDEVAYYDMDANTKVGIFEDPLNTNKIVVTIMKTRSDCYGHNFNELNFGPFSDREAAMFVNFIVTGRKVL